MKRKRYNLKPMRGLKFKRYIRVLNDDYSIAWALAIYLADATGDNTYIDDCWDKFPLF